MTMAIKPHWVPRFYLGAFATSMGGDRPWVSDIKQAYTGKYCARKERAADVAHMRHLYSMPRLDDGGFEPNKPDV